MKFKSNRTLKKIDNTKEVLQSKLDIANKKIKILKKTLFEQMVDYYEDDCEIYGDFINFSMLPELDKILSIIGGDK